MQLIHSIHKTVFVPNAVSATVNKNKSVNDHLSNIDEISKYRTLIENLKLLYIPFTQIGNSSLKSKSKFLLIYESNTK